jgi:rhodanese-related sulfurtransferase
LYFRCSFAWASFVLAFFVAFTQGVVSVEASVWYQNIAQSEGDSSVSPARKAEVVESLRERFPSRNGARATGYWWNKGVKACRLSVERSGDGVRWRTEQCYSTEGYADSILVVEALFSEEQIVSTNVYGSFEEIDGKRAFVRNPTQASVASLGIGSPVSSGGVYVLDCGLCFGFIRDGRALVDIHQKRFLDECSVQRHADGFLVVHGPSKFEFLLSPELKLILFRRPEYSFGADLKPTLLYTLTFRLMPGEVTEDGRFLVFEVCSSDDPGKKWEERYFICDLDNEVDLTNFRHARIAEGAPVFPVGTNPVTREKLKPRFFHDGKAVFLVDPDAASEIDKILERSLKPVPAEPASLETNVAPSGPDDVRKPLARIPYLRTASAADCGLYSLAIAAAKLNVDIPLDSLVENHDYALGGGSSVAQLNAAASDFGLYSYSVRFANFQDLLKVDRPAILHCGNSYQAEGVSHWSAILDTNSEERSVLWADLPNEPEWISEAELLTTWDGTAIFISDQEFDSLALIRLRLLPNLKFLLIVFAALVSLSAARHFFGTTKLRENHNDVGKLGFLTSLGLLTAFGFAAGVLWLLLCDSSFFKNANAVAITAGKVAGNSNALIEEWNSLPELDSSVLFVDARIPRDFKRQHIEGAINLPVDCSLLELRSAWKKASNAEVCVVYCQSSQCPYADRVAERLGMMGHKDVVIYRPGFVNLPSDLLVPEIE